MSESDETTDYRPIACETYSELELAIMHRDRLWMHWRDEEGLNHIETIRPLDLETRNHEEFLLGTGLSLTRYRIRLDRIVEFRKMDGAGREPG